MPSQQHTANLGLTQYANNGRDSVSFMGDYNHDMKTIDLKIRSLEERIGRLENQVEQLQKDS